LVTRDVRQGAGDLTCERTFCKWGLCCARQSLDRMPMPLDEDTYET
jgi:hypothetical protein